MAGIKKALEHAVEGKEVSIAGWVYRHRKLGENKIFIVVRDADNIIQAVVSNDNAQLWNKAENLYIESSIKIRGILKQDKRAPNGWEIKVRELEVINIGNPFPIQKDLSDEFLLDIRHLWLRSRKMQAIMKARHYLINYLREFLNNNGFYEIAPPIITKAGAEGGADMFELNYFNKKAYLTQSSQLYAEVMIFSLEKVYTLAPSFRAEKSRTRRHLAEFWHLEPEMAFYSQKQNMELQEQLISYAINKFIKEHEELLNILGINKDIHKDVKPPFPRLSYEKAVEMVNELGGKMEYGEDLGADEEALISKQYTMPIFITNYPKHIKAFYMKEDPQHPGTVLNDDMLAPYGHGEIIGGSERIADKETLIERIKEENLPIEAYQWYIDLRKYGSVPHSGFGLGIERFVKYVLNLNHIRDAIPFPRTINRLEP